jgi:hypothetical protein
MKIVSKKVEEVIVGNNEAGLHEYQDTGIVVESGDKAFTLKGEDAFSGETKTLYFKDLIKANMYKDGKQIVSILS